MMIWRGRIKRWRLGFWVGRVDFDGTMCVGESGSWMELLN